MKLAISGKGGVGKSTLAAAIAILLARKGKKVLAIDADEDPNLATALGASKSQVEQIIPISKRIDLIEERTGAKVKQYGQMFKINPEVSDISEKFAININGVSLLVFGAMEKGGSGCACPENVLLKALVTDIILYKDDILIMDMEAGVEHLGRATSKGVDCMLVVVEPGQRSVESSMRIIQMSKDIGLRNIKLVINKIYNKADEDFIRNAFPKIEIIGIIPFSESLRSGDRLNSSVIDNMDDKMQQIFIDILQKLQMNKDK